MGSVLPGALGVCLQALCYLLGWLPCAAPWDVQELAEHRCVCPLCRAWAAHPAALPSPQGLSWKQKALLYKTSLLLCSNSATFDFPLAIAACLSTCCLAFSGCWFMLIPRMFVANQGIANCNQTLFSKLAKLFSNTEFIVAINRVMTFLIPALEYLNSLPVICCYDKPWSEYWESSVQADTVARVHLNSNSRLINKKWGSGVSLEYTICFNLSGRWLTLLFPADKGVCVCENEISLLKTITLLKAFQLVEVLLVNAGWQRGGWTALQCQDSTIPLGWPSTHHSCPRLCSAAWYITSHFIQHSMTHVRAEGVKLLISTGWMAEGCRWWGVQVMRGADMGCRWWEVQIWGTAEGCSSAPRCQHCSARLGAAVPRGAGSCCWALTAAECILHLQKVLFKIDHFFSPV